MSSHVIKLLAYEHGDGRYAQYGLDLFPFDANYGISSVAKLL